MGPSYNVALFLRVAGGEAPGSQTVLVQSLSTTPITFTAGRVTVNGQNLVTTLPAKDHHGRQPQRLVIQPKIPDSPQASMRHVNTFVFGRRHTEISLSRGDRFIRSRVHRRVACSGQAGCTPTVLAPSSRCVDDLTFRWVSGSGCREGDRRLRKSDDDWQRSRQLLNGDPTIRLDYSKTVPGPNLDSQRTVSNITVTATLKSQSKNKGQVKIKGG